MNTFKIIAALREQRRSWTERLLELDGRQSELLAKSCEAMHRSRKNFEDTSRILSQPRMNDAAPSVPANGCEQIEPAHKCEHGKASDKEPRSPTGHRAARVKHSAALTGEEGVALRRIALGSTDRLAPSLIQRLRHLHLVEGEKSSWRLTALGQQQLQALPKPLRLSRRSAADEISRILAKFTEQK